MARDIDTPLAAHFEGRIVQPVFLFAAIFDSGTLRFWTGLGQIPWGGEIYFGFGNLIGISRLEETSEMRALNAVLTLSGVPSEILAVALAEPYQGRRANCWIAAIDEGAFIGEPYLLHDVYMDVLEIECGPTTSIVKMSVESRQVAGTRAKNSNYTHEDQQAIYPGDMFFSKVAELQDRQIILKP